MALDSRPGCQRTHAPQWHAIPDGPDVRPGRTGIAAGCFDPHGEVPQDDDVFALGNELFGYKLDDVLDFGHALKKLGDLLASVPGSREGDAGHIGELPEDGRCKKG